MFECKNRFKLAISPCPNDTYIFGNLILNPEVLHWDDPFQFETSFFDIQELNQKANEIEYDIIKVSSAHCGKLLDRYQILSSGSALGIQCGPLWITKEMKPLENLLRSPIILPGRNTTAAFLMEFAHPKIKNKEYALFSDIEDQLVCFPVKSGVIIHENRFTYQQKGLSLIQDLGQEWQNRTGYPIPLGVILIRKSIPHNQKVQIRHAIQESILRASKNKSEIWDLIQSKASELEEKVIMQHIELYVNEFSLDLGETGKAAIQEMLKIQGYQTNLKDLFI